MSRSSILLRAAFVVVVLAAAVLQYRLIVRERGRRDATATLVAHKPAPALNAVRPDGTAFRLEELSGKIVIVTFWATWCLPCVAEMPEIARFARDWNETARRSRDLVYVAVSHRESPEDLRPFLGNPLYRGVLFTLDEDGSVAERWKVRGFPTTFVIDPEGTIRDVMEGYRPGVRYRLRGMLREYLGARPGP